MVAAMTAHRYTLFATAIGLCAIVWSERGVAAMQLPEADERASRARLRRRFAQPYEATPPPAVQAAIESIVALLRGEAIDLGAIALDLTGLPSFHRRVYGVARQIPPGATLTYGEVAARLGEPRAARSVGQALGSNPFAIIVPCHRVLAAGGKPGGFSANGGVATKLRLLAIEAVHAKRAPTLFDALQ